MIVIHHWRLRTSRDISTFRIVCIHILLNCPSAYSRISLSLVRTLSSSASFHIDEAFYVLDSTISAVFVLLRNTVGNLVNV